MHLDFRKAFGNANYLTLGNICNLVHLDFSTAFDNLNYLTLGNICNLVHFDFCKAFYFNLVIVMN